MRRIAIAGFLAVFAGCTYPNAGVEALPDAEVAAAKIAAKEPKFIFLAPDGCEWHEDHGIWYNQDTRTSVSLAHSPTTTFDEVCNDFTADKMLANGMELLTKELRSVEGRPTLLVSGNRLNGRYPQKFCTVAFATKTGCAQITAIYPESTNATLASSIEHSLVTSRHDEPD